MAHRVNLEFNIRCKCFGTYLQANVKSSVVLQRHTATLRCILPYTDEEACHCAYKHASVGRIIELVSRYSTLTEPIYAYLQGISISERFSTLIANELLIPPYRYYAQMSSINVSLQRINQPIFLVTTIVVTAIFVCLR